MGAPTKFTPPVRQRILDAIALGLTHEQAATSAGIDRETLWAWRKAKPAFSDELEKAAIAGMSARLERIQMAAHEGNWQADAWWLERRFPDQWGKRERVDVNHSGQVDVRVAIRQMQAALDAVLPDDPAVRQAFAQKVIELDGAQHGSDTEDGGDPWVMK
jgi:transposase